MKKVICSTIALLCLSTSSFASNIEDTSIVDALAKQQETKTSDFKLQTFDSCSDMESVMKEYFKLFWDNSNRGYSFGGIKG
ncbi:MAG: hypothetical protein LBF15_02975 [Candidatus Peribacteria bacterium]|jgi:uncharacterized protein YccT (UPF0319 family)|nr:hypothetical protein [Candidatus Peribacteria bacterium]